MTLFFLFILQITHVTGLGIRIPGLAYGKFHPVFQDDGILLQLGNVPEIYRITLVALQEAVPMFISEEIGYLQINGLYQTGFAEDIQLPLITFNIIDIIIRNSKNSLFVYDGKYFLS